MTIEEAQGLLQRGDREGAETKARELLTQEPDNVAALTLLAGIAGSMGRREEARDLLNQIIANEPDDRDANLGLFELASSEGRAAEALDYLEKLPEGLRAQPEMRLQEANLAARTGDRDRQISILKELVANRPELVMMRVQTAYALASVGKLDEAEQELRSLLSGNPGLPEAWRLLADITGGKLDDRDVNIILGALSRADRTQDKIALNFALFRIHDAAKRHEKAFEHVREANHMLAELVPPPTGTDMPKVDRAVAAFTADKVAELSGMGHDSDSPIFIVGLPRSGSTLVEQILASHPDIEGTSELPVIPQLIQDLVNEEGVGEAELMGRIASFDGDRLKQIGEAYIERSKAYRQSDRPRFTDKLTGNWSNVFLIRAILPNAKIVETRRHPMATGWSIYSHFFASRIPFQSDLKAIGHRYRAYLRMMDHFDAAAPNGLHRINHDQIVADSEAEIRKLLDFVGVDFNPACLEPHKTDRAVSTVSHTQVREPINSKGVDHWKGYEPYLSDLAQALGDAVDRWKQ